MSDDRGLAFGLDDDLSVALDHVWPDWTGAIVTANVDCGDLLVHTGRLYPSGLWAAWNSSGAGCVETGKTSGSR